MTMLIDPYRFGDAGGGPAPGPDGYRDAVVADSPITYLRFDDAQGASVAAAEVGTAGAYSTSSPPTIQPHGGPTSASHVLSTSRSQRVTFPVPASMTTLTVECWVRLYDDLEYTFLVDSDSTGQRNWSLRARSNGTVTFVTINNGVTYVDGTTAINDGEWHHVAAVANGTDVRIYIDGALDGTPVAKTGNFTGGGVLTSGLTAYMRSSDFNGSVAIAEFALYSTALSAARVAAHVAAATPTPRPTFTSPEDVPGLLTWLDASTLAGFADGNSVTSWTDRGPRGDVWTSRNTAPTYVANGLNGQAGLDFFGGDVVSPHSHLLAGVTVFAVVEPEAAGVATLLGATSDEGFTIDVRDDGDWRFAVPGQAEIGRSVASLQPSEVVLLEGTEDAKGSYLLARDGVVDSTGTGANTAPVHGQLAVGGRGSSTDRFSGRVFALLIYGRVLDASERDDVRAYLQAQWMPTDLGMAATETRTFDGAATDGLLDWFGTVDGARAFRPPGRFELPMLLSSNIDRSRVAVRASDHSTANLSSALSALGDVGAWWRVDFGRAGYRVVVDHYGIQGRTDPANHPRSWELQGSQDAVTWTTLDTQTANTSVGSATWFTGAVASTTAWRYLRIKLTAANSSSNHLLSLGEVEVWGTAELA